jgi:hypothetical protein
MILSYCFLPLMHARNLMLLGRGRRAEGVRI